jgi:hypothetical protein
MAKGSRPRPFSIGQEELGNRIESIFGKKPPRTQYIPPPLPEDFYKEENMTPSIKQMKKGTCGCGRSPTGNCMGWHGLTEDAFRVKLAEYNAAKLTESK